MSKKIRKTETPSVFRIFLLFFGRIKRQSDLNHWGVLRHPPMGFRVPIFFNILLRPLFMRVEDIFFSWEQGVT